MLKYGQNSDFGDEFKFTVACNVKFLIDTEYLFIHDNERIYYEI